MSTETPSTSLKTALVTAAAGVGIGGAVARQLAEANYDVIITDAHERRCRAFAEALQAQYGRSFLHFTLDVTDHERVGQTIEKIIHERGRLDVLINNAGWSSIAPLAEMSIDTWRRCVDVDLTGTFSCIRHALPHMIRQGGGAIVNLASIAAWEMSEEHGAAYSAAKAGVAALTRVAAAENGRHGIRVNAVAPGLIYNEFLRRVYPPEFFEGYAANRSRVGRMGTPQDVAELVAFLVSEKAGYITGEVFGISGGVAPLA